MGHTTSDIYLSIAERDFRDCMQHGDDFFKIELLRQAKKWYTKALEFNIESDTVKQRIAECEKMLMFERKVTGILAVVALVIVGICWIIWN
jgi:hypothetical protein